MKITFKVCFLFESGTQGKRKLKRAHIREKIFFPWHRREFNFFQWHRRDSLFNEWDLAILLYSRSSIRHYKSVFGRAPKQNSVES
jgi:hypothetical protein